LPSLHPYVLAPYYLWDGTTPRGACTLARMRCYQFLQLESEQQRRAFRLKHWLVFVRGRGDV